MKRIDFYHANTWKFIGLVLIISSILWFGNYFIRQAVATLGENKGNNLPIYSVETDQKVVSISFDAAWGNEDTKDILDILDEYGVKVTFFLVSRWVEQYPEDVKLMVEKGHDIGNHSSTHPHMTKLSTEQCKNQIMDADQKVLELTGYKMDLFRFPYGDYDGKTLDVVRDCGYYAIQWDVDSHDWKEYGVQNEIKTVLEDEDLKNGSIILFHNNAKFTPLALPAIIEGLQEMGYKIVPLSELIIKEDYRIDHKGRQYPVGAAEEKATMQ